MFTRTGIIEPLYTPLSSVEYPLLALHAFYRLGRSTYLRSLVL